MNYIDNNILTEKKEIIVKTLLRHVTCNRAETHPQGEDIFGLHMRFYPWNEGAKIFTYGGNKKKTIWCSLEYWIISLTWLFFKNFTIPQFYSIPSPLYY